MVDKYDNFQQLIKKYNDGAKGMEKVKRFTGLARLTEPQERFVEYMVFGCMTKNEALAKAYPNYQTKTEQQKAAKACELMRKPHIRNKYNELMQERREKLVEESKWTRQNAIEALKFIYNINRAEHERVDETYNQQIDFILMKIEASSDLVEKQKLLDDVIKLRKERRASQINNSAMISAVSELNKMHGYNSEKLVVENESMTELDKRLAALSNEDLRKLVNNEQTSGEQTDGK